MRHSLIPVLLVTAALAPAAPGEPPPFDVEPQVFHDPEEGLVMFALRLEQPFLAEEFEKVGWIALESADDAAFLIYPRRARFDQRHAEFHGRLQRAGDARLRLEYEVFTEGPEGEKRSEVRTAEVGIAVPLGATGPRTLYRDWARAQNAHFAELLRHYPDESFLEYVLLQSADRYGIAPPTLERPERGASDLEHDLYFLFSGGLSMQPSLQRRTLGRGLSGARLDGHVADLTPPALRSLPYARLLERRLDEEGIEPVVHDVARLVPADQYFLHAGSMQAADDLFDVLEDWLEAALLVFRARHDEQAFREKLERQLALPGDALRALFREGVVSELSLTGSDPFLAEGTDLTVLLKVERPDVYRVAAASWLAEVATIRPALIRREFHYRGRTIRACYTPDRAVSSFVVELDGYAAHSNSHRAIRLVVDALEGDVAALAWSDDYRYLTTVLPPQRAGDAAWFFASEPFVRRLLSPAFKISEKRRLQCLNNLVMLNNAALFHRLDLRRSPSSLSDLVEGRFIDEKKLACPHGGAYAFDVARDACTCSLHNQLAYLTPNAELEVLQVSAEEKDEYERYRGRYEDLPWRVSDPIAARIRTGPTLTVEIASLPFVNSPSYDELRELLPGEPRPLGRQAPSADAVMTLALAVGHDRLRAVLRGVPGVPELLAADPALADLAWIGRTATVHVCDGDTVIELDPTRLRQLELMFMGSLARQGLAAAALTAASLPFAVAIDVEEPAKADRFLEGLRSRIFLEQRQAYGLPISFDAYRTPDHRGRPVYVVQYRVYALTVRLHLARIGGQLVAATQLPTLQSMIDSSLDAPDGAARDGHLMFRLALQGIDRLKDDLRQHCAEKARSACHRNVLPFEMLARLYEVPAPEVDALSRARYGVTWSCPDGGTFAFVDDRVVCSLHGNREESRQAPAADSAFERILARFERCVATVRFDEEALVATFEVTRKS